MHELFFSLNLKGKIPQADAAYSAYIDLVSVQSGGRTQSESML